MNQELNGTGSEAPARTRTLPAGQNTADPNTVDRDNAGKDHAGAGKEHEGHETDEPEPTGGRAVEISGSSVVLSIDLNIQSDYWHQTKWTDTAEYGPMLQAVAKSCSEQLAQLIAIGEIGLALCDDAQVQSLNRQFRGQDKPTNVLSFPAAIPPSPGKAHSQSAPYPLTASSPDYEDAALDDAATYLGDIAVCFETVTREAIDQRKHFDDHFRHLMVHGVLHLLGHDHEDDTSAEQMEALEVRILADLGISNPYDDESIADTHNPQEG